MNFETIDPSGHTTRDAEALIAAGVDPTTVQPRETQVPCRMFSARHAAHTSNLGGGCDQHYVTPAACDRAGSLFESAPSFGIDLSGAVGTDTVRQTMRPGPGSRVHA